MSTFSSELTTTLFFDVCEAKQLTFSLYLFRYSPLHNIRKNGEQAYPAVLITTGDHDDRVVWILSDLSVVFWMRLSHSFLFFIYLIGPASLLEDDRLFAARLQGSTHSRKPPGRSN